MDMLNSLLRITMIVLLFRAVISIVNSVIISKRMKKVQTESADINLALEQQKRQLENELLYQLVQDDYCGKMRETRKAYILRMNDQSHHFCSWECRQKFIQETS